MKIKVEHIIGFLAIFLGIITIILTLHFPKFNIGEEKVPGPSFFPNIIAVFLIFVGILEFFEAKHSTRYASLQGVNKRGAGNVLVVIVAIFLYIISLMPLGFIITTFLFSLIIMYLLGVGKIKSIVYSFIVLVILILIFEKLFRIPLPGGFLNLYI